LKRLARAAPALALGLVSLLGSRLPGYAGEAALYLALGVFPGMALGTWWAGRAPGAPRWTLGLALAPLASASAGAALLLLHVPLPAAARIVAVAGWALWLALSLRAEDVSRPNETSPADRRFLLGFGAALALYAALPWLVNRWVLVRGDSWVHAGLTWEIVHHGIPPQDPRFAGLTANYMWFYNLFVAMLTGLGGRDPFVSMALLNTFDFALCAALAYRIALELWGERESARGAALLTILGLNAGAWLLWLLNLGRVFIGSLRGWPAVRELLHNYGLGRMDVIFNLTAPFSSFVMLLDKFTIGTSLSYAWLMMLLWLWALARWLERGRREALAWAAAGAAGMLFMHTVVGASVIPVGIGALALAWLVRPRWPWLPGRGRLAALALATAAGALVATPYTLAISRGWAPSRSGFKIPFFQPSWVMVWTLVTACAVTFWFARGPFVRAFRERRGTAVTLGLFTLGMTVFALVVHLRLNNESKFVFQVFFALALFGGPALLPAVRAWLTGRSRALAAILLALVFLAGPALVLEGYCADPGPPDSPYLHSTPGELVLYAWIRERTPEDAVFVEARDRGTIQVLGQRRQWVGTTAAPELAAFPVAAMRERRAIEADLYGSADSLDADARALASVRAPVYLIYRASDFPAGTGARSAWVRPWRALEARADLFERVYDAAGIRVYRLRERP